ncbi:MAG: butyrate kinase [Christensenella sp.]|nr:butyrate kinase [Christensenella sp.]
MISQHFLILVINPGSTSTKIAVFEDDHPKMEKTIRHTGNDFAGCASIFDQKPIRIEYIDKVLAETDIDLGKLDAVVGRGGLVRPIDSGTYLVNDKMMADLIDSAAMIHASSLGGLIAADIGKQYDVPAYVVDPVVVDEMETYARLSGFPGVERRSAFHALNTKAVARRCATDMGINYEDGRFVVAHMGGGISVGAHRYGRVIDVNDAISGEGSFSPERCGAVPLEPVIEMCYSGRATREDMLGMVSKHGGMIAYLGTNDLIKVEKMIREGDEYAALVVDSMAYQVSKEIGAMVAALEGRVDAIILTGGLAYSIRFTGVIKQRVDRIAKVITYPGENEMDALAQGALRVLRKEQLISEYR